VGRNEMLKVVKGAAVVLAAGGAVAACGAAAAPQGSRSGVTPTSNVLASSTHGHSSHSHGGPAGAGSASQHSSGSGTSTGSRSSTPGSGAAPSGGSGTTSGSAGVSGTAGSAGSGSSSSSADSGSTASQGVLLGHGVEGPASEIPWSDVTSGWTMAMWGETAQSSKDLFVVDPEGGRYLVTTGLPAWAQIVGWSGDAQRVLIEGAYNPGHGSTITEYDLASGAALHQFATTSNVIGTSYTEPHGLALLSLLQAATPGGTERLQRIDLNGNVEVSFPQSFSKVGNFNGSAIETADGTEIVMGAAKGLAIVGNDGTVVSQLTLPHAGNCQPVHWWSAGVALVMCSPTQDGPTTQGLYWAVPVAGGAPTELPKSYNAAVDVYQLANGSAYGQGAACGVEWIENLEAPGSPRITPPGTPDWATDMIVGTAGNNLVVNVMGSCDEPQHAKVVSELLFYSPQSGTVQPLLGGSVNGGFITDAFEYGTTDGVGYEF
jgi:hypothetical protein